MIPRYALALFSMATLAGCAATGPGSSPEHAARMKEAGDRYTACVTEETEKDLQSPARAEDIALAAHGRCWAAWEAYLAATRESFSHGARSREELQYARDKTEAHVRQFELEARRTLVDWIVQRNLPGRKP